MVSSIGSYPIGRRFKSVIRNMVSGKNTKQGKDLIEVDPPRRMEKLTIRVCLMRLMFQYIGQLLTEGNGVSYTETCVGWFDSTRLNCGVGDYTITFMVT